MTVILRELQKQDEQAFMRALKDWEGQDLAWISFLWQEGMTFEKMLELLHNEREGIDLKPGRVPHTMFYGFVDGDIVGRVSIRHTLNDYLRRRGGHIGYSVSPRFRRQGLATQMVTQALAYCKSSLGLEQVMVTCADDNVPSWKIIEHFGGVLEEKVWDDEDEEMIRKYWVPL